MYIKIYNICKYVYIQINMPAITIDIKRVHGFEEK